MEIGEVKQGLSRGIGASGPSRAVTVTVRIQQWWLKVQRMETKHGLGIQPKGRCLSYLLLDIRAYPNTQPFQQPGRTGSGC